MATIDPMINHPVNHHIAPNELIAHMEGEDNSRRVLIGFANNIKLGKISIANGKKNNLKITT